MALYMYVFVFDSGTVGLESVQDLDVGIAGAPPKRGGSGGTTTRSLDGLPLEGLFTAVDCKYGNESPPDPFLVFVPGPVYDVDDPEQIVLEVKWEQVRTLAKDWVLLRLDVPLAP